MFPVELIGDLVALREIRLEDLDAALLFGSDPEVTRHLPFEPRSPDQERSAIGKMMSAARSTP